MAITTFVTTLEMPNYYSAWTEHNGDVRNEALSTSYGLVLSFLNPTIQLPLTLPWDGISATVEGAPPILKMCQAHFAQYQAQFNNVGYTEEMQALFNSTADLLRSLQQGEISIPYSTISSVQTGWTLASSTATQGTVHILNPNSYNEIYPVTYELKIDSVSSGLHPYHSTFNTSDYATFKYRLPNLTSTYQQSNLPADNNYTTYGNHNLTVSFEGAFNPNDTFIIRGVPIQSVNVSESTKFVHQRSLRRGA